MNAKKIWLVALWSLAAVGVNAQFMPTDADSKYATQLLKPGVSAPDFKAQDLAGKTKKLSKLIKGKYTVLDFWASWCPDCRKDLPQMKQIYEKFAPLDVQFVGISFDDKTESWQKAVEQYGLSYPQLSEGKRMRESEVANMYGVKWIPSMMLLDKEGKVVLSTVLIDKLEKTLTEIMAKERPAVLRGETQFLTIDGSKGALSAIIQKPILEQGQQCPMVIMCHGFSGNKNGDLFELIADSLMNNGIATLRFDFNGHGESDGPFVEMTVPNEIEDALKVMAYARDLRYVSQLAIMGHSQGGVVASMVAGKVQPGDLKAVALMAPAAVLRDDAIRGNTMGVSYDPLDPPEYVNIGPLKLGRDYIKTAFSLPIYETAQQYHGDALIVHGTADRVVPYTYGERYHQIWPDSQIVILDAYDHGFSQNVYRAADIVSKYFISKLLP